MRIGVLAERSGVSRDALRFYERQGLIRADRHQNGYRDYSEGIVSLVALIRQAQALGFTLAEIGALLQGLGSGLSQGEIEAVLREKLAEIDARMAALVELRAVVETRLEKACPLGMS
ncbi:Mercuric resistance operon regulatory protein [Shimia sp. SK013]|uniref:MerR family transcriptional regulator n=1 Tax=Shimia sp. SK013 TaxID=1389006 RepID=UPI0006B59915|nr:MerR family transcriptional regulator [Shimia sp. SK013]KPA22130.1 Mercuric resistance operon regulatory protein [Shimia sp. SK013]